MKSAGSAAKITCRTRVGHADPFLERQIQFWTRVVLYGLQFLLYLQMRSAPDIRKINTTEWFACRSTECCCQQADPVVNVFFNVFVTITSSFLTIKPG